MEERDIIGEAIESGKSVDGFADRVDGVGVGDERLSHVLPPLSPPMSTSYV